MTRSILREEAGVRRNPIKRGLQGGGIARGSMMLAFDTPGVPQITAAAGVDFAVFDMERTGWSLERITPVIAASRCARA